VDRRIADDPALADVIAPGFELRFDQHDDAAAGAQQRRHHRQDVAERDERHVDGDDLERARVSRQLVRGQVSAR
jgi:hypothetical protein